MDLVGCNLEEIIIPPNVGVIGEIALSGCKNLVVVFLESTDDKSI